MKTLTACLATAMLVLVFASTQLQAASTDPATRNSVTIAEAAEANAYLARLDELKEIDKSTLTKTEKKELRNEVREIKANLKAIGGGVYISAAALVLIVVLILLL
jgi:hypothetical protein